MITIITRFDLGQVVATPGAQAALEGSKETPELYLARHGGGDWGEEMCESDKALNDRALVDGDRLMSAYKLKDGTKIWIITECDRSVTTLLLPEEY